MNFHVEYLPGLVGLHVAAQCDAQSLTRVCHFGRVGLDDVHVDKEAWRHHIVDRRRGGLLLRGILKGTEGTGSLEATGNGLRISATF